MGKDIKESAYFLVDGIEDSKIMKLNLIAFYSKAKLKRSTRTTEAQLSKTTKYSTP